MDEVMKSQQYFLKINVHEIQNTTDGHHKSVYNLYQTRIVFSKYII